jgi:hypothetical protein
MTPEQFIAANNSERVRRGLRPWRVSRSSVAILSPLGTFPSRTARTAGEREHALRASGCIVTRSADAAAGCSQPDHRGPDRPARDGHDARRRSTTARTRRPAAWTTRLTSIVEYGVFGFDIAAALRSFPGDLVYVFDNHTVTSLRSAPLAASPARFPRFEKTRRACSKRTWYMGSPIAAPTDV